MISDVSDELFAVVQVDLALQLHLNGEVPERLSGALLVLLSEPTIRVLGGQNVIAMIVGRTPIELSHASCPRMPGLSRRPLCVSFAALTVARDGSSAALCQRICSMLTQCTSDTPFFQDAMLALDGFLGFVCLGPFQVVWLITGAVTVDGVRVLIA